MRGMNPRTILLVAFVLLVIGWVIPFLMMIDIIVSSFALGFVSFAMSILGLFLGIIGIAANWFGRRH